MHNHHVECNCVILLGFTHLSLPYGKGKCIASLPCIWRRNLSHPKLQVTSVSFAWELKKASLEEKYGEIQKLWSNTKALEASRLPNITSQPLSGSEVGQFSWHHQQSWTVLCQLCFFKGSFYRDSFWGVYFWFLLLGEPHFPCRGHQILVLLLSKRKNQKRDWKLASSGDTIQQNSSPTWRDPELRTTSSKFQPISWAMRL